jgi:hypothetical protein
MDTKELKFKIKVASSLVMGDQSVEARRFLCNRIIGLNFMNYSNRFLKEYKKLLQQRNNCTERFTKLLWMENKLQKWPCRIFNSKKRKRLSDLFVYNIAMMVQAGDKVDHFESLYKDWKKQHEIVKRTLY